MERSASPSGRPGPLTVAKAAGARPDREGRRSSVRRPTTWTSASEATSPGRTGGHPWRPGIPVVSTWTRTGLPVGAGRLASASSRRATLWKHSTSGARARTLLRWRPPGSASGPGRSATASARLGHQLARRSSPPRRPARPATVGTAHGPKPLVTGTTDTSWGPPRATLDPGQQVGHRPVATSLTGRGPRPAGVAVSEGRMGRRMSSSPRSGSSSSGASAKMSTGATGSAPSTWLGRRPWAAGRLADGRRPPPSARSRRRSR